MPQVRLTTEERVHALERLGYGAREADFVCRAALHGGYFLRRQYARFLGKSAGGTTAALIDKLLAQGHARGTTFAGSVHVYHLCSRPLYAALGQEDNRNRRLRQPTTIKRKLMGFDFVLQHPEREYLATEQDKVEFFVSQLGLDRAVLPASRYATAERVTERFFVEKFPMFVSPSELPARPPVVSFSFIDEGEATLSGFLTFLQKYSLLWSRLQEFQLIYVAAHDAHFRAAENAFDRFSAQFLGPEAAAPKAPDLGRLLEHFEVRRRYDAREWTAFDRARLIQYRRDRQEFSGDQFEALYRLWKTAGSAALMALMRPNRRPLQACRWTFLTYELKENYDFFGRITTY